MKKTISLLLLGGSMNLFSANASADIPGSCNDILAAINANTDLVGAPFSKIHAALQAGVDEAISHVKDVPGPIGLNNHMWATISNRDGVVCAVAFSGDNRGSQWPGSRVISAEKAYTANAYSLNNFAVSTAMLYAPNLDGAGFYGLQFSNLMNPTVAYGNPSSSGKDGSTPEKYGKKGDPLTGRILGGHIIFGGGFGLYDGAGENKTILGGIGVSGDTACYDHSFGWILRDTLGLDRLPNVDNLIYDADANNNGIIDGFEHVPCGFGAAEKAFVNNLPVAFPPN